MLSPPIKGLKAIIPDEWPDERGAIFEDSDIAFEQMTPEEKAAQQILDDAAEADVNIQE